MLISAIPAKLQHKMRIPNALLCPSNARAKTARPAQMFLPAAAGHAVVLVQLLTEEQDSCG